MCGKQKVETIFSFMFLGYVIWRYINCLLDNQMLYLLNIKQQKSLRKHIKSPYYPSFELVLLILWN